jgi:dTDP-4-amino-4,6-dideoxygalactose transaminase
MPTIPFVDLRAQHEEVRPQIEAAIRDIIDRSCFVGGSYVSTFEKDFAAYLGAQEAVAVGNGTDALWLALVALGVGPGDAVITVPNTFIATVEAITRTGALPIFVDIDLHTANLSVPSLAKFLETECAFNRKYSLIHMASRRRVAAILPVHLYGLPVDMDSLMHLAQEFDLPVIEDACQAHGARCQVNGAWKRAGTIGKAAGFSFYPGKNLGAMGEGGAAVTNDVELAGKMRWLRDHGSCEKYVHVFNDGWNCRLDAIQAAVLSIKLKKLDEWNARRRAAAECYRKILAGLPLALPVEPEYAEHISHLDVVRAPDRSRLQKELNTRGIGTGLHYPIPLHLQSAYHHLGLTEGSYPNAECSASTVLSLPMHPTLTPAQVEQVGDACAEILLNMPHLEPVG